MNSFAKISTLLFLTVLLVLIRHFEASLFYDPLLLFFEQEYISCAIPQLDTIKLFANVALRFLMNTSLSLLILWVLFKDISIIKLSAILYTLLFVILAIAFVVLFYYSETKGFLPLFYVRRFLIQPLFLLILVPAFYFQQRE